MGGLSPQASFEDMARIYLVSTAGDPFFRTDNELFLLAGFRKWQVAHSSVQIHPPSPNDNSVPHSSQLYRDEWAAKSHSPLLLDFNHSSNSIRRVPHS
jgi:hypothetical protein